MHHSVSLLHIKIGTQDIPNNGTTVCMSSDVRAFHTEQCGASGQASDYIQEVPDSHLGLDINYPGGFFVLFLHSSHMLGYCPKI
jgi:hypothetical protein